MKYFELYDLPISLIVDKAAITKKYYALCKAYHPDKFSLQDANKQEEALEKTALVNQAKKTLSHPDKRLAYILKETSIIKDGEKHQLPPMFLGEMMEINEALMELEFEENDAMKDQIKKQVEDAQEKLFEEVKTFFDQDELVLNPINSQQLKEYYYKKKYLDRIKEKL